MNAEANLEQTSLSAEAYSAANSRIFPIMVGKCWLRGLTARPGRLSRNSWAGSNYCLARNEKSKLARRWWLQTLISNGVS